MRILNSENVSRMSVVDIRVVLYGVAIGLAVGATQLSVSAERATALGLAVAIEYSVGLWLATKIWFASFPALFQWLDKRLSSQSERLAKLRDRADKLIQNRALQLDQSASSADPRRRDPSAVAVRLAIWCILLIPFGITSFTIGAITAIMDMGLDIHSTVVHVPAMIVGAALTSIGIAIPTLNSLLIDRRLTMLENELDSVLDPAIPSLESASELNRVYGWTNSILGKLVGYKAAA